ncbi:MULTISPECIES: hypothetical protein [unclassified Streptomyces]|uniref:hypothetical protein n=1 Tax=unclassified Streptomyces TaxID=2593676 RepID=UPI00201EE52F|nr:hypothetical protein [Streptomyces sp. 35G-GA-8]MCL7376936.1 hypothetical protein [Streptomyces sp. 35G-GA-8]
MNLDPSTADAERLNWTQYRPGQEAGHYESFYQRGNHPTEPRAFWIRYTIFSPAGMPQAAIGELWAIYFDGTTGRHVVAKEEYPISECHFSPDSFSARVHDRVLETGALKGEAAGTNGHIGWDLTYEGSEPPLLLLPPGMYTGSFPKAKSLVGVPLSTYSGKLTVDGETIDVDGWTGSQNHNWGSRHTDHYAFGQVAGFDEHPDSFLEIVTGRTKLVGPVKTPKITFLVLRHEEREYSLSAPRQALKAKADFGYFYWDFTSSDETVAIRGRFTAAPEDFVGLNYYNPPGGIKHCLNTKIGRCELEMVNKATGKRQRLTTSNRALMEILTDDREHGIAIRA